MKKAILYARVEKQGIPNPNENLKKQEAELRKYCEINNYQVIRVVEDIASGTDFNRLEFTKAYLEIRTGKLKADYFLFTTIDVFSTHVSEVIRMHNILVKLGVTPKGIKPIELTFIGITIKKD